MKEVTDKEKSIKSKPEQFKNAVREGQNYGTLFLLTVLTQTLSNHSVKNLSISVLVVFSFLKYSGNSCHFYNNVII